jgi:site-specific recombinase XerD
MRMRYKTLIIERGVQGRRLKKPLTIKVPEQQGAAEKKLLQYVLESLNRRTCLIPIALENSSIMKVARHLLFNRTGSQLSLYGWTNNVYYFCRWMRAQPDQLVKRCLHKNGIPNSKEIARMTRAIDEYADYLQTCNLSPNTIKNRVGTTIAMFKANGVRLGHPYGLSSWSMYEDRAPTREEIQKILDIADLRERVIITILAVSGLRVGTFLKLQYRHVRHDLERDIVPIHVHVEAEVTKGKRRSYDTFLNEEASTCLKAYLNARKKGTKKIPSEQIHDESPLIRTVRCRQVKTMTAAAVQKLVHNLYVRAGVLENVPRKRHELRTHSFRRFFRTQMATLGVDRDCIGYMMGHRAKDRYHDVRVKGVEYLRGVYLNSRIRIRPKTKMNKFDALKEIIQAWGLTPNKILTDEALSQLTPNNTKTQANNRELLFWLSAPRNQQPNGLSAESSDAQK